MSSVIVITGGSGGIGGASHRGPCPRGSLRDRSPAAFGVLAPLVSLRSPAAFGVLAPLAGWRYVDMSSIDR